MTARGRATSGRTDADDANGDANARRLTLLRHGRAASPNEAPDDHGRALVDSGRRDVASTLSQAAVRADPPDRILCSDARRTVETAACALETLGLDAARLETDARLYLASPETLLEVIAEQDARDVGHLMIIGHNPGLEMLAASLDARADGTMSTAALCRFARRLVPDAPGRAVARLLLETRPPRR